MAVAVHGLDDCFEDTYLRESKVKYSLFRYEDETYPSIMGASSLVNHHPRSELNSRVP